MTPRIIVLATGYTQASRALAAQGLGVRDPRLNVVWRAESLRGLERGATAVVAAADARALPDDLRAAMRERSLEMIPLADLPAALARLAR